MKLRSDCLDISKLNSIDLSCARSVSLDLAARRGVDHVAVVVRDFLAQALGRVGEEIAMLVHIAAATHPPTERLDYQDPLPPPLLLKVLFQQLPNNGSRALRIALTLSANSSFSCGSWRALRAAPEGTRGNQRCVSACRMPPIRGDL